jgi:general secretion pathway protein B
MQAAPIPVPAADTLPAPANPAPAPAPASPPGPVAAPVPALATTSPPPPAAASAVVAPGGTAPLLSLSDLSADERRQLPPLKLSMHLWSPDPARRFVILDGHRLVEGDRAGAAVLERIADDGVVLAWNGYRLRLPLR